MRFIVLLLISQAAWSISPSPTFRETHSLAFVENFRDETQTIDLSQMPSSINYADLTPNEVKKLDALHEAKRDYGRMFGFADWKLTGQKLLDINNSRVLLLEGNYKNQKGHLVSFLEVYWANQKESKQFLLTSQKKGLKLDDYQKYFQ